MSDPLTTFDIVAIGSVIVTLVGALTALWKAFITQVNELKKQAAETKAEMSAVVKRVRLLEAGPGQRAAVDGTDADFARLKQENERMRIENSKLRPLVSGLEHKLAIAIRHLKDQSKQQTTALTRKSREHG